MIEAIKAHSKLRDVLEAAGVHLERDKGLCPFHEDKHPSLTVKGEKWRCWSCGEGGDVIDFTAKYYNLATRGAIKHLADRAGIRQQAPAEVKAAQAEREKRQQLLRSFREWEQKTVNDCAETLWVYRCMIATKKTYTEEDLINLAELKKDIDYIEHLYEILCTKDDEAKFKQFQEDMAVED